jgi:hypothetical protein
MEAMNMRKHKEKNNEFFDFHAAKFNTKNTVMVFVKIIEHVPLEIQGCPIIPLESPSKLFCLFILANKHTPSTKIYCQIWSL